MKGKDFKAMIERIVGDDQDIVIADPTGAIYDVKVVPFMSGGPKSGRFIVIPHYNRPEDAPPNLGTGGKKLLPRPRWAVPEDVTYEALRDVLIRYRDDTDTLAAKALMLGFFTDKNVLGSGKLTDLLDYPQLWRPFAVFIRRQYEA